MKLIQENEGRHLFGLNAEAYDDARPPYPNWMFETLISQKALFPDANTLEIGAGNGLATRRLIELGISSLTVLEPDKRFAPLLHSILEPSSCNYQILHAPFEEAPLSVSTFDLVISATAFHWLDAKTRVQKLAHLVKSGGYVALLWNVFQDLNRADPFHETSKSLLESLPSSPSGKPDSLPFALDKSAREKEFLQAGEFELVMYAESHWQLELNPKQLRNLYAGFSNLAKLDVKERDDILNKLVYLAQTEFSGRVIRNMTSPLYLFRRT